MSFPIRASAPRDVYAEERARKNNLAVTKQSVRWNISDFQLKEEGKIRWMEIASKVSTLVIVGFFAASSLLPIVLEATPSWLPWTALGVGILFGYISTRLQLSIDRRKKEFEGLQLYQRLLEQNDLPGTLLPEGVNVMKRDPRLKSERKVFPRPDHSMDLRGLLIAETHLDENNRWRGITDKGGRAGLAFSYYHLDVDPRIAKAYAAADYAGMEGNEKAWSKLAQDVAHARQKIWSQNREGAKKVLREAYAEAYKMPTPFTRFAQPVSSLERDEVRSLYGLNEAEKSSFAELESLDQQVRGLYPQEPTPFGDFRKRRVQLLAEGSFASLEALSILEGTLRENYESMIHDHPKYQLYLTDRMLGMIQRKLKSQDFSEEVHKRNRNLVEAFNVLKGRENPNWKGFRGGELEPFYKQLCGVEEEVEVKRTFCEKCSRMWKSFKEVVLSSEPTQPFSFTGHPRVIKIQETLQQIDKAMVRGYYARHLIVGWLAVAVMCFVEYAYFSNTWVVFGINAGFLALMPINAMIDIWMKKKEKEKNLLRMEEGLWRGQRGKSVETIHSIDLSLAHPKKIIQLHSSSHPFGWDHEQVIGNAAVDAPGARGAVASSAVVTASAVPSVTLNTFASLSVPPGIGSGAAPVLGLPPALMGPILGSVSSSLNSFASMSVPPGIGSGAARVLGPPGPISGSVSSSFTGESETGRVVDPPPVVMFSQPVVSDVTGVSLLGPLPVAVGPGVLPVVAVNA